MRIKYVDFYRLIFKIQNNLIYIYREGEEILLSVQLNNASSPSKITKSLSFGSKSTLKKTNEFNFMENLQKYGLDDSNPTDQNLTGIQGSYLSFLLLRHLRIRDLKRQVQYTHYSI